jgi:CRISPR-associated protein Cmr1
MVLPRKIASPVPKVPKVSDGAVSLQRKGWFEKTYRIEVITPMFGGVFPGETDPVTPVRTSSIRGQLRFWWRATMGADCKDSQVLADREGEIWGTTERESRVQLSVDIVSEGMSEECASRTGGSKFPKPNQDYPGYVIFPFQGTTQDPEIKKAQKGVIFNLHLACPEEVRRDAETALWAFCNFGGLGARTRRGCGALFCKDFAPSDRSELGKAIQKYRRNDTPEHPWPELFTALHIKDNGNSNAISAWKQSIQTLQTFRQGNDIGRNPGEDPKRPGRSRWPEPETIRKITGSRDLKHQRMAAVPDDGFPRADFGLPIIFQFQSNTDPKVSQLLPYFPEKRADEKEGNRMASPLILRPLLFKDGKAASMILFLRTPPLEAVILQPSRGDENVFYRMDIVDKRFASYNKSPLGIPENGTLPRSAKGSAIEGFLSFAKENGFEEVNQ